MLSPSYQKQNKTAKPNSQPLLKKLPWRHWVGFLPVKVPSSPFRIVSPDPPEDKNLSYNFLEIPELQVPHRSCIKDSVTENESHSGNNPLLEATFHVCSVERCSGRQPCRVELGPFAFCPSEPQKLQAPSQMVNTPLQAPLHPTYRGAPNALPAIPEGQKARGAPGEAPTHPRSMY